MFAPGMGPYVAITVVKTPWIKDLIQTLWIKQLPTSSPDQPTWHNWPWQAPMTFSWHPAIHVQRRCDSLPASLPPNLSSSFRIASKRKLTVSAKLLFYSSFTIAPRYQTLWRFPLLWPFLPHPSSWFPPNCFPQPLQLTQFTGLVSPLLVAFLPHPGWWFPLNCFPLLLHLTSKSVHGFP